MKIKTNIVKLLAMLAILGSLVAMAVVPAAAMTAGPCADSAGVVPPPTVTWSASSAYPGQAITGSGTGFTPGASITVTMGGKTLTPAATVIVGTGHDPSNWTPGTWTGSFTIPDMPAGDYTSALANGLKANDGALASCATLFTVVPNVKDSPTKAGVGDTVTLTGRGFTYPGTATAKLYTSAYNPLTPLVGADGLLITNVFPMQVNEDGTVSGTFAMPDPVTKDLAGSYRVVVVDSENRSDDVTITLTPSIDLIPANGQPGQSFTVQGKNFPAGNAYIYWQNYVNGQQIVPPMAIANGNFIVSNAKIPSAANTGSYYVVAISGSGAPVTENSAKALISVGGLAVTFTPSSAVAGTTVTLQGSGFTPLANLASVNFGSVLAPVTGPTAIPASGSITTTIVVPPLNPGSYTVVVQDDAATAVTRIGMWTVASPTITVSPTAGPVGTMLTVNGSGWIPTTNSMNYPLTSSVAITMAGQPARTAQVSSAGRFSINMLVPATVTTGANTIVVQDSVTSVWVPPSNFSAVATFNATSATITMSPNQGVAGQTITFTGAGFPAYGQVNLIEFTQDIGLTQIVPVPMPQTDANGAVTGTFVVPASISGVATVVIWSGAGTANPAAGAATFNIVSGAATPASVFASMVSNSQLAKPVWSFDNTSKTWSMYDPNDLADSTVTLLTPGSIYWINVNANVTLTWGINVYTLTPGWNGIGWQG